MHCIEQATLFSRSRIWQLQRDYFNQAGINAWRSGEVPHYITSNPVMGKTYAELVLALLRDLSLKGHTEEPVYLLELGAGHGRLCYHFFKHFEKFYNNSAMPLPPFCYVLSDFTETNLDFWRGHPRLQPYYDKGWLDYCLYDVESTTNLNLQYSNKQIQPNSLVQPILAVGNYFLDTIPQDLFKVENGTLSHTLLSLHSETNVAQEANKEQKTETENSDQEGSAAQKIDTLHLEYAYHPISDTELAYEDEPELNRLLETYRETLSDSHVLLPHIGLRCLTRLQNLSQQGLVLLTADKGEHHLSNLDHNPAPGLVTHGSFSLTVNYHALQQVCTNKGGLALFPLHQQASLDLGCLLFLPDAHSFIETRNAYERFVADYGPDDYFSLKKLVEPSFETANYRDILAVTRLSGCDARIFVQMLPRLFEILPTISDNERWNLLRLIPKLWDTYYPLAEADDFADDLGNVLMTLHFFNEAILYFEQSINIYGTTGDGLYKIALCQCLTGEVKAAAGNVKHLLKANPNEEALQALVALIDEFELEVDIAFESEVKSEVELEPDG
ncbi:hypothetical protein [Agarivorans sp. DSG3-1]|uniref:hypothetical protein n=1 Tax=Agarivorans sp. DSG3-1 TaxID=3342249 RepID=UPI00398E541A